MGTVENKASNSRLQTEDGIFIGVLIAGLVLRIYLVSITKTPGTSDPAFYYTVAKSISEGRGLVIDYVGFYFNGLVPITHYSNDYWEPLASILLSLPMFIFGKTVTSALIASVIAGVVPALIGYFATLTFYQSKSLAAIVGAITFFSPFQIFASVLTDSIIFWGAFGSLALFLSILGRSNSRYYLIAAVCTGLANMTRQDGVLLLATVLVTVLITQKPFRTKTYLTLGIIAVHFIVLSPLLIRNAIESHSVLPSGTSKTLFLTNYEDMYSYNKELDWQTYRSTLGIKNIIDSKFATAIIDLQQFTAFLDPVIGILTLLGLADLVVRKKWAEISFLSPALILFSISFLAYSFLWSIHGPGSFDKCLTALMPFIAIIIAQLFKRYIASLKVLSLITLVFISYTGYQGFKESSGFTNAFNQVYITYNQVGNLAIQDAAKRYSPANAITIMAREPWDVNAATGLNSIMIPNNDLDTIYFVAQHYHAEYLILPAPRQALKPIFTGQKPDSRFKLIANIPGSDLKLYRIEFNP